MTSSEIHELIPEEYRADCRVGVCSPAALDQSKRVHDSTTGKWSARSQDICAGAQSVVVVIHHTTVALDYGVETVVCDLAQRLFDEWGLQSHVIDEDGNADPDRLAGMQMGPARDTYDRLLLLKEAAYWAGLGQYGKSGLILHPEFGSDIKIQALFLDCDLSCDTPLDDRKASICEGCEACADHCPGAAIPKGADAWGKLAPERCLCNDRALRKELWEDQPELVISRIPRQFAVPLRNMYAFDDCRACQAFCPANSAHYIEGSTIALTPDMKCHLRIAPTNP